MNSVDSTVLTEGHRDSVDLTHLTETWRDSFNSIDTYESEHATDLTEIKGCC